MNQGAHDPAARSGIYVPSSSGGQGSELSELLRVRLLELEVLRKERATHMDTIGELEVKIAHGEILCGRLIQNWLKIQRAMELKKKHVAEDKEQLSREQQSRNDTDERINSVLADISKLMLETGHEPIN